MNPTGGAGLRENLPAALRSAGLSAVGRIALVIMAFSLTAMNAVPIYLSCGLFCAGSVLLLIADHVRADGFGFAIYKASTGLVALWGAWTFVALLSMVANFRIVTLSTWAWSYALPLLMLMLVLTLRPTVKDLRIVFFAMIAGWAIRFGYSAIVFGQTVGFGSLEQVLNAHFYLDAFQGYARATYGSTGRTIALVVPAIIVTTLALFTVKIGNRARLFLAATLFLISVNALITGSRALMIVVLLVLLVGGLKSSMKGGVLVVALAVVAAGLFFSSLDFETQSRFAAVLTTDRYTDNSVRERWDSIDEGLGLMMTHPFGVGPGRSPEVVFHSVAHQFAVFQGSELGVGGFLAVIALYALVGWKFVTTRPEVGGGFPFAFRAAAFGWFTLAMLANSPIGSGPNMPWVGLVALMIALSEIAPRGVSDQPSRPTFGTT